MSEPKMELGPIQKKWIAALRSGEYQQGKSSLCDATKDGNKYCCLGVLCDVLELRKKTSKITSIIKFFGPLGFGDTAFLPSGVPELVGLRSDDGCPEDTNMFRHLYALNDSLKKTFPEIADILEANPEQYFTESK